jgi:tetratricopeptide (TPR) repeat protein
MQPGPGQTRQQRLLFCRALGQQCLRLDRWVAAAEAFDEALGLLDTQDGSDALELALLHAELLVGLSTASFEIGRFDGMAARMQSAAQALEAALPTGPPAPTPRACVLAGWLRVQLAQLHYVQRAMPQANAELDRALAWLQGQDAALLHMRIEVLRASVAITVSDPATGLAHLDAALAWFNNPLLAGQVRSRGRLQLNRGSAMTLLGRLGPAKDCFEDALNDFEALRAGGSVEAVGDVARCRKNLGVLLEYAGQIDASIAITRAAIADYDAMLPSLRGAGDVVLFRASRASTMMNLAFSLLTRGDLDEADTWLQRAAAVYRHLVPKMLALRDQQARIWVNQAHVAALRGKTQRALRLYEDVAQRFETLIAEGRTYHEIDVLNARLGLARMQLRQGEVAASAALFEATMLALTTLTQQGAMQHVKPWLTAWQEQAAEWLDRATRTDDAAAAIVDALLRVLGQPPARPLGTGADPVRGLGQAAQTLLQWSARRPPTAAAQAQSTRLAAAFLQHLFSSIAEGLADADPDWIQQQAQGLAAVVDGLREAAAAQPDAARLLADWFFSTRGLRAQRNALAQGGDARHAALRAMQQRLHALEQEILGQPLQPSPADTAGPAPPPPTRGLTSLPSGQAPTPYGEQRAQDWRDLRAAIARLRDELVEGGLLPAVQRLSADRAGALLDAHSALLLLARIDQRRVLVNCLQRGAGTGWTARCRVVLLDDELSEFSCLDLNRLARRAVAGAARGSCLRKPLLAADDSVEMASAASEDGDLYALELVTRLFAQVLQPLLASLANGGCRSVDLLPSDDLHLLPWRHLLDLHAANEVAVAVYPSSGAWLQARLEQPANESLQWAAVAGPALDSHQPLMWVQAEHRGAQRMWGTRLRDVVLQPGERPRIEGVTALLGMGHGGAPDGNPTHAGLALEGCVLLPQDLPRLRHCSCLLLSACVLGQTAEAQGEPLGFLSSAFDYKLRFAVGWLTEVPDRAACLYSLALQWVLLQGSSAGAEMSWREAERSTRLHLLSGVWPPGFSDWLAAAWPSLGTATAGVGHAPAAPPQQLLRVLPWLVAMGR